MLRFFAERNLHYMVMEKCRCSLLDVMREEPHMIEDNFVGILQQALLGLIHCHDARVVHRDVKPENFLFGGEDGNVLKLCDFGLAVSLPKKGYVKGVSGTAPYMSPELLANKDYNCKTDVWSFAVVVYLMLNGHYPYEPKIRNAAEMKKVILSGKPAPRFSQDEPGDFARDLLKRNPQERSTAREALQHEFLKPKPSLKKSWTSEADLGKAGKLAKAVSREFKDPTDPGRTKDLNDLLDDLQERGEQFYLADEATAQEQCTIVGDEATEGYMMDLVRKHNSTEKVGQKTLSFAQGAAPWCADSEFGNRSTQVSTCETLPPLDLVSDASDAPQDKEEELFKDEKLVEFFQKVAKVGDGPGDVWDPAQWTV